MFKSERKKQLAVESLEDRCRSLEHRCEDLERGHKGLALEWEELYDKVRHQMSRMSRRVKAEAKDEVIDPETEPQIVGPIGSDEISQSILRRRSRGAVAK